VRAGRTDPDGELETTRFQEGKRRKTLHKTFENEMKKREPAFGAGRLERGDRERAERPDRGA
jgi:hypothetical protein